MRRILMILIYIRNKKPQKKAREESLQNLGVIGCKIWLDNFLEQAF